jgi:Fe-S-cluster containining protein
MLTGPDLPGDFYSHWLSPDSAAPDESALDCRSCRMIQPPAGPKRDQGPFLKHLKCCTYFPFVPNFSLGAIFSEAGPKQQQKALAAMEQGFVSPLGLFPTAERKRLEAELGNAGFGREAALLCPFFDSANRSCGIWFHRPGVCRAYFCVSQQGESGLRYWEQRERELNKFEWSLAHDVLWESGYTEDDVKMMEAARAEGRICPRGLWYGQAEDHVGFFKKSYQVARLLKP